MKNLFLFLIIFAFSCTKDDDKCSHYFLVTESNQEEAFDKCSGYANSYPAFKVISSSPLGCLNSEQLKTARRNENSTSVQVCNGVIATTRVVIK